MLRIHYTTKYGCHEQRTHIKLYYSLTCYEFIISQGLVYHDIGA